MSSERASKSPPIQLAYDTTIIQKPHLSILQTNMHTANKTLSDSITIMFLIVISTKINDCKVIIEKFVKSQYRIVLLEKNLVVLRFTSFYYERFLIGTDRAFIHVHLKFRGNFVIIAKLSARSRHDHFNLV